VRKSYLSGSVTYSILLKNW